MNDVLSDLSSVDSSCHLSIVEWLQIFVLELIEVFVVSELISRDSLELNAVLLVLHLEDSDADLDLVFLSVLILTFLSEFHLVFVLVDLWINLVELQVLKEGLLDHVWVIA